MSFAGKLVAIEGVEGAGKSTLILALVEALRYINVDIITTREPGGTELGLSIRNIILHRSDSDIDALTEVLLFAADRAQHTKSVILPALSSGKLIICDRYIHSTLAYQGYGRGLPISTLQTLNNIATNGIEPNLVILLDLDPTISLKRSQNRLRETANKDAWNYFEQLNIEFHKRVRSGFLQMAKASTENSSDTKTRFLTIDASLSPQKTLEFAKNAILSIL